MVAFSTLFRACGLVFVGLSEAREDAVAMVQGRLRLSPEPLETIQKALEDLGPFGLKSDTVAARLPGHKPGGASWGEDEARGLSVRGLSTDKVKAGSFVTGGLSKEQGHGLMGMGYSGLKDPKLPDSGGLLGAAKVTPQYMEAVGVVPNKDGTADYTKLRTDVSTGHLTSEQVRERLAHVLDPRMAPPAEPAARSAEKRQPSQNVEKQPQATEQKKEAAASKQAADKAAKEAKQRAIAEQAMREAGEQWAMEHRKEQEAAKAAAKYVWEQATAKVAAEQEAAQKALREAGANAAADWAGERAADARRQLQQAATIHSAEQAAQEKAAAEQEAASRAEKEKKEKEKKEIEERTKAAERRRAEEEAKAKAEEKKRFEEQNKALEEAKRKDEEARALASEKQAAKIKAAEEVAQAKKVEQEAKAYAAEKEAAMKQAVGDWLKKHTDAAWSKGDASGGESTKREKRKAVKDWIKQHADAVWGKTKSGEQGQEGAKDLKTQALGAWIKKNADVAWGKAQPDADGQAAVGEWLKKQADAAFSKENASKAFAAWLNKLANATEQQFEPKASSEDSKSQGTLSFQNILGSLGKAAFQPPVLLQRGVEVQEATQIDMADEHRKASEGANEAAQKIASAKATMSKALQTIQKAKTRITALEQENETATTKMEHAHAKRMKFANQARGCRLKAEEREGLKGKHLKFDKSAYLQRVKKGNFSTYGLWQTFDTKQHFGEKTWDILSNHIFGLDKLAKWVWNATQLDSKAKKYHKLEKHYAAMSAAASEELLELSSSIEQAQMDMEQAKADIADATLQKSDLKARKKEAKQMLAKEKAAKSMSKRQEIRNARRAMKAAEKKAKANEESSEEKGPPEEAEETTSDESTKEEEAER